MAFDRRETINGLDTVYYRLDRQDFKPDDSFYEVLRRFECGLRKAR